MIKFYKSQCLKYQHLLILTKATVGTEKVVVVTDRRVALTSKTSDPTNWVTLLN